jgi:hypothetical protein
VEVCRRESTGSANQTADMEVDWTYTEEGFLCHREKSFELEPPRTTQERKTEKEMGENNVRGS